MESVTRSPLCPAKLMDTSDKKKTAFQVIRNKTTKAADQHNVNRKFIRQQKNIASAAIHKAFDSQSANDSTSTRCFQRSAKS